MLGVAAGVGWGPTAAGGAADDDRVVPTFVALGAAALARRFREDAGAVSAADAARRVVVFLAIRVLHPFASQRRCHEQRDATVRP